MILYNRKYKERARLLRKADNLAEILLWKKLQKRQFLGLRFARQKPIANFVADFYCHEAKTVIEIDGSSHDNKKEHDHERDEYMKALGLRVIRILDTDVLLDIDRVMESLRREISQ